ncbi:kinase-like domain-containing protein [Chytriomyces sp. MP71]|nr:kinase-like domain-containing protein [Chytriomyces sp. MP71]
MTRTFIASTRIQLFAEIKIHQSMSHPAIVQFQHVFEDDDNVYIILELCESGTMVDLLKSRKRLSEPEVRYYMHHLLHGVNYMHSRRVIHRDLKLGNLFLAKDMRLKIGDFGLAATIKHDGERKKTICGTPNYIAPEVLFDVEKGHSFEVDMWSLGVVMYTQLIGRPPFQTKEVKQIYKKIRDINYEFPPQVHISDYAKNVIISLLNKRPDERPSVDQVLQHPFFTCDPVPYSIPVSALTSVPSWTDLNIVAPRTPTMPTTSKTMLSQASNSPSRTGSPVTSVDHRLGALRLGETGKSRSGTATARVLGESRVQAQASPRQSMSQFSAQPIQKEPLAPGNLEQEGSPAQSHRTSSQYISAREPSREIPAMAQQVANLQAPIIADENQMMDNPAVHPRTSGPLDFVREPNRDSPVLLHRNASPETPIIFDESRRDPVVSHGSAKETSQENPILPRRNANFQAPIRLEANKSDSPVVSHRTSSNHTVQESQRDLRVLSRQISHQNVEAALQRDGSVQSNQIKIHHDPASTLQCESENESAPAVHATVGKPINLQQTALLSPIATRSTLDLMHKTIQRAFAAVEAGEYQLDSQKDAEAPPPEIFITKWIDYSNKYGLGYQLHDGSMGVYFNDSTSILLSSDGMRIEYLFYEPSKEVPKMHRRAYTTTSYPQDLKKKVTLLRHFGGYMQENLNQGVESEEGETPTQKSDLIFLTKYLRTKHGVIFRLSNQVVQINFFDHTKIILSQNASVVTYIDKNRSMRSERIEFFLAMREREVVDRVQYAQDVLQQMILKKQKRGLAGAAVVGNENAPQVSLGAS